ncbi:MAG TPA: zinc-dependent metalloprotease [Candidatus Lustribacter sp.]
MGARRSVAGFFAVVLASLALAVDGLGAAVEVAPVTAPPSPAASVSPAPLPAASGIPNFPSVLRALIPLARASAAPAQAYATFMHGAEHQDGVIDLVRKDDQLYLDLRPENFGKPYIILPSISSGVGGEAFAGRVYDPLVVIFKRVGKRVMWVTPNTRYVADKGTSAAASLAVSVADSVIQATTVIAEDPDKTHVVIEPTFFLSDFEGIGADLGKAVKPPSLPGLLVISIRPSFSVDATKSYYLSTKGFPLNDEISVNLTFNGPANALPTVPDGRGIPLVVHYSIVAPPAHDPNYVPRYADDRVGYFITARKHFGNDVSTLPTERFIDRWNLLAGPIVFTLTSEIPPTYRDTVRRGILAWNAAFAKVGYPHAIVVRDPPTDPHFDPEDARYNSVRWITSDAPDFVALSPHVSDPDTGQIIRTEVVIDGESMRAVRRGYVDRVLPVSRIARNAFLAMGQLEPADAAGETGAFRDDMTCADAATEANEAALGMTMLVDRRHGTARQREAYAQAFLYSTVMHEVGHTLGLRHNFAGSTAFTYAQLHDPAFTHAHGTTGSVMDYTPANIAAPGERQADYFPNRLGPYDYWAIEYGYAQLHQRTSSAELPALRKIAARSTQPGLAYGTDEDAIAPFAIDPRIQRFDLSNDPLAFARAQFRIDDDLTAKLTHPFPGDTRSYQDLRQTLVSVLNNDLANISVAARYIGGVYTSRSHRGQAGGVPPFVAIPRAEQRRAFALIDHYVLSAQALNYPPQMLNDVAPIRYSADWSTGGIRRTDFPIREVVAELQDSAIADLFNPASISRIANESFKETHAGQTMDLADLFAWTNAAIFDDLGSHTIAAPHRDLQRRFADLELQIAFLSSGTMDQLGVPREIQSLARYELRRIRGRLDGAYRDATDLATRAHLDDLRSRIDSGLHPGALRPL